MRNRMQDLDFEQTVAFDSVKDFEFTRKAAQKFRLDSERSHMIQSESILTLLKKRMPDKRLPE